MGFNHQLSLNSRKFDMRAPDLNKRLDLLTLLHICAPNENCFQAQLADVSVATRQIISHRQVRIYIYRYFCGMYVFTIRSYEIYYM